MLTVEWQSLSPRHGYTRPEAVDDAGRGATFDETMERSARAARRSGGAVPRPGALRGGAGLQPALRHADERPRGDAPDRAAHAPQGHPAYRVVAQEMHRLIAEQAGHQAVAEMMRFVDHSPEPQLERLDSERRAEAAAGPVPVRALLRARRVFCVTSRPGPPLASLTRRGPLVTRSAGRHVARRTATSGAGSDLGQQRVYDPAAQGPTRKGLMADDETPDEDLDVDEIERTRSRSRGRRRARRSFVADGETPGVRSRPTTTRLWSSSSRKAEEVAGAGRRLQGAPRGRGRDEEEDDEEADPDDVERPRQHPQGTHRGHDDEEEDEEAEEVHRTPGRRNGPVQPKRPGELTCQSSLSS